MKIVALLARLLLGLIFVVLGLNGFLNFLSMGSMPTGLAGQFIGALIQSHYFWVVAALQVAGGALLLVMLAVATLAPWLGTADPLNIHPIQRIRAPAAAY